MTAKVWDPRSWGAVVQGVAGTKDFPSYLVQVGDMTTGSHPALRDAIDLVGRTDLRNLLWLVAHCDGVITHTSLLMHMAAALRRPCVVIAGGRENPYWGSYDQRAIDRHSPGLASTGVAAPAPAPVPHRFLDSIGGLPCCTTQGCLRKGLGELVEHLNCLDIVPPMSSLHPDLVSPTVPQPRCLFNIEPRDVVGIVLEEHRKWNSEGADA